MLSLYILCVLMLSPIAINRELYYMLHQGKILTILSSILSASFFFDIRGSSSALPLRSIIITWLLSEPKPQPLLVTSLATIISRFFLLSLSLALAISFWLSAAKPTFTKLPSTAASISGVLSSSSVSRDAPCRLILFLATSFGR